MNTLETNNNSILNSPHLSSDYLIREGVYGANPYISEWNA